MKVKTFSEIRVHPVAALFPMMSEEELHDLASDIKTNDLIHPIVLGDDVDSEGKPEDVLIDGRNRWRACEIAGVKPRFEKLNGQDPVSFCQTMSPVGK
jgi:ParB-like chromosome segregation protein Spo0J